MSDSQSNQVKVYRVATTIRIYAETEEVAIKQFEQLRKWIGDLSLRGHRGVRFLYGFEGTPNEMETIVREDQGVQQSDNCQHILQVKSSFEIVADSQPLAVERFEGFRQWLKDLSERGHPELQAIHGGTVGEAESAEFAFESDEDWASFSDFLPKVGAWFDSSDRGGTSDEDAEAVFRWDAEESLILRTDERFEAVESLEMAQEMLSTVENNPYRWKWVILSLHNALQAYMVLALAGTDGVRVLREEHARSVLKDWHTNPYKMITGNYQLDTFLSLYEKIKETKETKIPATPTEPERIERLPWMHQFTNSQVFVPKGSEDESVQRLNTLRNMFVHYRPTTLIQYIETLPSLVGDVCKVIRFLTFESNNIDWLTRPELGERTRVLLELMKAEVTRLSEIYGIALKKSSNS